MYVKVSLWNTKLPSRRDSAINKNIGRTQDCNRVNPWLLKILVQTVSGIWPEWGCNGRIDSKWNNQRENPPDPQPESFAGQWSGEPLRGNDREPQQVSKTQHLTFSRWFYVPAFRNGNGQLDIPIWNIKRRTWWQANAALRLYRTGSAHAFKCAE